MTLGLPPYDPQLSPYTGWTRAHWERCADHLLDGAARHSSPSGARIRFPGARPQNAIDELEGFARSFLLGALRLAGGGHHRALADRLAGALDAGTRAEHPDAWPAIGHHDQTLVEATAIAVGLHWSRQHLWDRLADTTRERIVAWLSGCRGAWCADNNHVLLGATVQAFLASVGADHDAYAIEAALHRMDEWYVGDGWYTDGVGRRFDHYNGWTFHLYPFLIEQLLSGQPADVAGRDRSYDLYRSRLRMFLDDYQHLFDASGGAVLQGRSLIYRWGMAAPFWMGQLQDATPLSPGRTRRLASGMLAGFVDAGAIHDGILGLGWMRPARDLLQSYNAPGSPLWASKGFLGLLLPSEHPVWSAVEEPLPNDADVVRPLSGPNWLAVGRRDDRSVRMLNLGSDGHPRRADKLYRRLAFSSVTVPVAIAGIDDNTISIGPREAPSVHRGLLGGTVHRDGGSSRWRLDAQGRDVVVDYATLVVGDAEVRLARLGGVLTQPVRCTGWAASSDAPLVTETGNGWASATDAGGRVSAVAWLDASNPGGTSDVETGRHPHALGDHVGLPWLGTDAGPDGTCRLAWLVHLGAHWDPSTVDRIQVLWLVDGAVITVDGRDHHCAWIRESGWPGDTVNQGIFRAGTVAIGG